jgi:signal recognition particle GTPase
MLQITPARFLDEIYKILRPEPLDTPETLKAFYKEAINNTRGGDKMQRIRLRLKRAAQDGIPFKACVMGHRGVGKSTELSRLIEDVGQRWFGVHPLVVDVLAGQGRVGQFASGEAPGGTV